MSKKPFGLDIDIKTMKLVSLASSKDGFLLQSSLVVPTPAKGVLSESPLDQEEMAQAIKKAVSDGKIEDKYVNIALAENQVYTKVIEMPALSDNELSSAIYWEAEQYIPIPLPEISFVWNILQRPQRPTSQDKMQVLMVGAPNRLINKYKKIISMAGLSINAMETEILSVVRALILGENFPVSLILHIEQLYTSLAIVKQGVMVFTYSTPTGAQALERAIATGLGISQQEASEYSKTYGLSDKVFSGKIGLAAKPVLMSLLTEVKKALSFYMQKYKDSPITQILLSGQTARLSGLDAFFASNSGIETAVANPWKVLASQQIPKEILDNAPDYTVSVGLAMRDYE